MVFTVNCELLTVNQKRLNNYYEHIISVQIIFIVEFYIQCANLYVKLVCFSLIQK